MKKTGTMIVLMIFALVSGAAAPDSAKAVSLDQYLNGNASRRVSFSCDVSGPDSMPAGNAPSGTATKSHGITMGTVHKYTGYGTIIAAAAAAVSGSDDGFHKGAGDVAAALALATCITGFAEYHHYFEMEEGFSAYNVHMVLATLATAGFIATAVDANSNDDDGHAGLGIGSGVLMVVPVVVLYF